jgi:hypothetical protein
MMELKEHKNVSKWIIRVLAVFANNFSWVSGRKTYSIELSTWLELCYDH